MLGEVFVDNILLMIFVRSIGWMLVIEDYKIYLFEDINLCVIYVKWVIIRVVY